MLNLRHAVMILLKIERPWVTRTPRKNIIITVIFDWWNWMYKDALAFAQCGDFRRRATKFNIISQAATIRKRVFIPYCGRTYYPYTLASKIQCTCKATESGFPIILPCFDRSHSGIGENASDTAFARTMINCAPYYVPIGPDGNYTVMANGKILGSPFCRYHGWCFGRFGGPATRF